MQPCPCGLNNSYLTCCGRFIDGKALPATAEELMRSRYTAYTLAKLNYIEKTMKGPALKEFDKKEAEDWVKNTTWLGLEVIHAKQQNKRGWVEFIANYITDGEKMSLHELSEFHLTNGKWFYVDGDVL